MDAAATLAADAAMTAALSLSCFSYSAAASEAITDVDADAAMTEALAANLF